MTGLARRTGLYFLLFAGTALATIFLSRPRATVMVEEADATGGTRSPVQAPTASRPRPAAPKGRGGLAPTSPDPLPLPALSALDRLQLDERTQGEARRFRADLLPVLSRLGKAAKDDCRSRGLLPDDPPGSATLRVHVRAQFRGTSGQIAEVLDVSQLDGPQLSDRALACLTSELRARAPASLAPAPHAYPPFDDDAYLTFTLFSRS